MFKFIHAADLHLDSPLRGLARYESAPAETIRGATRKAMEKLVELALEEEASFVILAGDLFDGNWKDFSTGLFLNQQIGILGRHDIRVVSVAGNHDAANKMTKTLQAPENMTRLSSRKPQTLIWNDLGVALHGQSFKTQHTSENLARAYPPPTTTLFNIGILHTSLDGRPGHDVYAPCTLDDLQNKGYDYWALGHIHQREIVSKDPWIVYPGCLQGRHIREAGARGAMLVSVDEGKVQSVEFRALDVFRWAEMEVDLSACTHQREVLDRIRRHLTHILQENEGRPHAVRLVCRGKTSLSTTLHASPESFEHEIRALAAEVADDELWIEKIELKTEPPLRRPPEDDDPLSHLIAEITALPEEPAGIEGFEDALSQLRSKMPTEAFGPDSPLRIDDPLVQARLIAEAKELLIGRLMKTSTSTPLGGLDED